MAEDFENFDALEARARDVVERWTDGETLGRDAHSGAHPSPERATGDDPAWGSPVRREPRWQASVAVVAALILYVTLPSKLVYGPSRWALPALEAALLIPLTLSAPHRHLQERKWQRMASLMLVALINAANLVSLGLLLDNLVHGSKANGIQLLESAAQIWLTTVIIFGLWYWELDRGGPGKRCEAHHREPDFLFPQMVTPDAAPGDWHPAFMDYLYVSFTNATAFSPTDTMPLTHWAKLLMMIQSFASLVTVALVAARAVNILA